MVLYFKIIIIELKNQRPWKLISVRIISRIKFSKIINLWWKPCKKRGDAKITEHYWRQPKIKLIFKLWIKIIKRSKLYILT